MVERKVIKEITSKGKQDIKAAIIKLKDELRDLRNAKVSTGSASKLLKIGKVRKAIARHLTILNLKERKDLSGSLHKHSHKRAQFLREKLTRAIRRKLTKEQKTKKILKTQKKALNFPLRKYGLKA